MVRTWGGSGWGRAARLCGWDQRTPVTYRIDLAYDNWDRLVRAEFWGSASSLQFTRYHGYDSLGNATWSKDGVGKETRRAYDAASRIVDEWLHQRNVAATPVHMTRSYNDAPSDPLLSAILTRTDGVGNVSEYRYDLLGRMVDRRLPGHTVGGPKHWTYTYDLAGRLAGWVDGNGTQIAQIYDAEKRLQERRVIGLPTNGVTLSVLATNEAWTYDNFDRVASAETQWAFYPYLPGGIPAASLVQAIDQYDGIGRPTLERFSYLGGAAVKDLSYGYAKGGGLEDASFRRTLQTSGMLFTIGTTPDGAGKLSSMTLSGPGIASQPLADWWYEGSRPVQRTNRPGSAASSELLTVSVHNQLRHMTQATTTRSGSPVWDLQMERDVEGNVLQHRYAKMSGRAGDWFQLDGWDRLQEAKLGVQSFSGTYSSATVFVHLPELMAVAGV